MEVTILGIINSNNPVSRNEVYGKVYITNNKEAYDNSNINKRLKSKSVYGKNKNTYGSKGAYSIE